MQIFILAITCLLLNSLSSYEEIPDKRKLEVLSPSLKEQEMAKIRLANGLEAMIISDPSTNKAGAVLTVLVGSWSDPANHPGMAHFLEHMLFLGTEEYPDENEYQRFIHDHGGDANAFTTDTATSFMFAIDPEYLNEALARFSSFFKKPLLNTSQAARELKAIDQEYAKNIENDDIREYFVHKALLNPKHPSFGFSMGNSSTLRNVSTKELREFYETHYSAGLMRLIVVGKEPLDQLKSMVEKDFSSVQDRKIARFVPDLPLSNPEFQGKLVVVEPVKDVKTLGLIFEIPKKFIDQDTRPYQTLNHVLGHEGTGSLLSVLKEKDLADGIYTSELTASDNNGELSIDITLTDDGVKKWQEVLLLTFQALKMLSNEEIPAYVFNDMQTMQKIEVQFQTRKDVFSDLMKKGMQLSREGIDTFPEKLLVTDKFDPKATKELAKMLTLDKAYITLKAKENLPFPVNQQEKWVGAKFGVYPLPKGLVDEIAKTKINKEIRFPEQNPFLPKDFTQRPQEKEFSETGILPLPRGILQDKGADIFFARGTQFQEPKIALSFFIRDSQVTPQDARSIVLAELYLKALNDQLNPYVYPAQVAGLKFVLKRDDLGFLVNVHGYSDTTPALFNLIADTVKSQKLPFQRFSQYKASLMREYQNAVFLNPTQMSILLFKAALYKYYPLPKEKAEALAHITDDDFRGFTKGLFAKGFVQGIILGNLSSQEAKAIAQKARDVFAVSPLKPPFFKREVVDLKDTLGPLYLQQDIEAQGNAALLMIESPPPYSHKMRAIHQILAQALEEPFYSELRTKQQTGYIVQSMGEEIERRLLNLFVAQSNTHSPRDLLSRFELFIETFMQELSREQLTEERFEMIKNALLFELMHPVKNLSQAAEMLSNLLFLYNGDFHWLEKRIEALKNLKYEETLDGIQSILGKGNPRRFALLLKGKATDTPIFEYHDAQDLNHFKAEEEYSPAN